MGVTMTPETVLAIMLALGPSPGRSLYSQVEVDDGNAPLVALRDYTIDGASFMAFDHWDDDEQLPSQCSQPKNVACRRPRYDKELRRWERPETFHEGLERYWTIAQAISKHAPTDAVAEFLIVITRHESGWRRDVHAGENHLPFRKSTKHEDAGMSWSLGQVMVGKRPTIKIPWRGWEDVPIVNLVGVDEAATNRCLDMVEDRVTSIVKHCGRRGQAVTASCVFVGYAGTSISAEHRLIRARRATHLKLKNVNRTLGDTWRALLGLNKDDPTQDAS